jgi:hypothetical protein
MGRGNLQRFAGWLLLVVAFNLLWELAQLPLYTIYSQGTNRQVAYAVGHCTVGDALIGMGCYAGAVLATRDFAWIRNRLALGGSIALTIGVAYTAFSEWLNVSIRGAWAYTEAMPTVAGVGLAPLLQWIVVPLLASALMHRGEVVSSTRAQP